MAMGTRTQREKQEGIWIAQAEIASAPAHPFYQKLNELLEGEKFDEFVEERCAKFYAPKFGRPSLTPGIYFRCLLIGYFEGIDGERGIAWRLADSLALRKFVGIGLEGAKAGCSPGMRFRSEARQIGRPQRPRLRPRSRGLVWWSRCGGRHDATFRGQSHVQAWRTPRLAASRKAA
jgi:hypothetical protein